MRACVFVVAAAMRVGWVMDWGMCGFGGGIGFASALEVAEGVEVVLESRAPERECKVGREIAQEPNMGGLAR